MRAEGEDPSESGSKQLGSHRIDEEICLRERSLHNAGSFLQIDGFSASFQRGLVHLKDSMEIQTRTRGLLNRFCMTSVASIATGNRFNRHSGTVDLEWIPVSTRTARSPACAAGGGSPSAAAGRRPGLPSRRARRARRREKRGTADRAARAGLAVRKRRRAHSPPAVAGSGRECALAGPDSGRWRPAGPRWRGETGECASPHRETGEKRGNRDTDGSFRRRSMLLRITKRRALLEIWE